MRILHVIRSLRRESGGPLEGTIRLSDALMSLGHEVELVGLDEQEEAARLGSAFPVTALGRGTGIYGYNPRLHRWMAQNAERFDVIILHGLWNYSSFGCWRALRSHRTPYFVFVHGMMGRWFRERFRIKHLAKQLYWSLFEGRVLRDSRYALFTTEQEKLDARKVFFGFQDYKETIVPYGASGPVGDEEAQRRAITVAFPSLVGRRFLLFVGRLHQVKGCDLLIQAFAQSQDQIPPDVDLVFVGPDQVRWTPELKALAKKLRISDRVHWTGMVTGDLKWGMFRSCEALILPSHHENFGMVVIEAMACSKPVLISDKVSIWREVAAESAGLIEPDTIEGTRQLILKYFVLSPDARSKMGIGAVRSFETHFNIQVVARGFARAIGYPAEPEFHSISPSGTWERSAS